ncbi:MULTISPECIES: Gfo/Idh/MocA family protein [Micromonospora]|uniref:Gfo/Idh/MocA family oxidoreductase n=1 Tax=Micromonospora solifontis TaxID=2487138 RepID=A0ABX9WK03_9ACTN|nr:MULTISPECIES: Gfo/Idh/MocA family oxidoreductase [Micromonospora]NES15507.1 Gfo/Idh/MocA family oxidoreductase [Micromonospora sp. PPF5-17B]NES36923.1 Gfo/Idh/MocA family oxidoreductase [Micromonospora solifontis]NES55266.1 Gfo/Idh/MocA family oxidoreductase [Micromonospora sp. PPF5-6]RNL98971.1 gfo/Idh/MocA family oxidoreductase [Micromonospora solifontis]
MTAKPRLALVGTGSMGSLHARVIAGSERAELAKVIEPRRAVGQQVAERYGAAWAPDLADLSDVDAVVIAAPTEIHHGLAGQVLDADKPLLIEKPVCGSLAESEEIVALSEKRGVPLLCGLLERFNPAVRTALALTHQPVHLTATRHSPYAPRIRTGVAWDLLIHDVDLAIQAFRGAEPTSVQGTLGYFHPDSVTGAEDVAETVLNFGDGALANVSASRIGQRKVRTLVINEVDRLIEADLIRKDVTIYRHVSSDAATPDGRGYRQQSIIEVPELITNQEPLAAQLDHFLDILAGTADADEERRRILPAHRVVGALFAGR